MARGDPAIAPVVTPNMAEAAPLTGTARATVFGQMQAQGEALVGMGAWIAVISGGHGRRASAATSRPPGRPPLDMRAERLGRSGVSGLSADPASAIAAQVAQRSAPFEAVRCAKIFLGTALAGGDRLGNDDGPALPRQMVRMWRRVSEAGETWVGGLEEAAPPARRVGVPPAAPGGMPRPRGCAAPLPAAAAMLEAAPRRREQGHDRTELSRTRAEDDRRRQGRLGDGDRP